MFHLDDLACKDDSFNSSFPICMSSICLLYYFYYNILFIYLLLPFTVASTMILRSTKSGKSKHPCVESTQPLTIKYHVRFDFL